MKEKIDVLDKGYVRIADIMGGDLKTVNAARVSYNRASNELNEKDIKLIRFLARENHASPFRHSMISFEIYAPLMVARQWWKYAVGGDHIMDAWNESSRRYVTEDPTFYIPNENEWRSKPEKKKQGSGDPVDEQDGKLYKEELEKYIDKGYELYQAAMNEGIAPEQARLFLPAYGMYVRWYWTASFQSVVHFLEQRLESDAQKEIQEYANAVYKLIKPHFTYSIEGMLGRE